MISRKSFIGYISETLNLDVDSDELETCLGHCLRYVCKCDTYTQFNKNMASLLDFSKYNFSESDFRIAIRGNGYLLTGLKYYALSYAKGKNCPERAESLYARYDIFRCDAKAIKHLFERKGFKTALLRETTFDTAVTSISPGALHATIENFVTVLPAVTKFAKVMLRNLRFINQSNNFQKDEFESEFIFQALRTYYYIVPTNKVGLELENYLRASMKKHQVNLIKSHTTLGRQRLVNEGVDVNGEAKFSMSCVSQSQMNSFTEEGEELDYDGLFSETTREKLEREEFMLSVDRLILRNLKSKKKRRRDSAEVLAIIVGRPNKRFEKHLREKNLLRSSNKCYTDFIDEKPREIYISEISQYLDVSISRTERYLAKIGKQLALTGG